MLCLQLDWGSPTLWAVQLELMPQQAFPSLTALPLTKRIVTGANETATSKAIPVRV
jgi:hypothetical protein